MALLFSYLRNYTSLVALALVLATINQVFSLLDPLIFRYVIDEYATRFQDYSTGQFFRGVSLLLAAAMGGAFVSRVAKNFQDYVDQRHHAAARRPALRRRQRLRGPPHPRPPNWRGDPPRASSSRLSMGDRPCWTRISTICHILITCSPVSTELR